MKKVLRLLSIGIFYCGTSFAALLLVFYLLLQLIQTDFLLLQLLAAVLLLSLFLAYAAGALLLAFSLQKRKKP